MDFVSGIPRFLLTKNLGRYLSVGTVTSIWVTDPAARCAQQFVKDFEVKLGPDAPWMR